MRTFTTEHTVYNFNELSKEAQAVAIEKQREFENEVMNDWLSDDLAYKLEELLKQHKMKCDDPKIYYSLNYCQGDGAMFEGTIYWKSWKVEARQSGHYYHYNSKTFWNTESVKTGRDMPDETAKIFNDEYVAICQELEKYGYDCIETALSSQI
jgi:hypothetical protein